MKGRQFGNYRLIDRLGRGGMGEVWRATHIRLGRAAAVKVIRSERLEGVDGEAGLTALRRFEREARATSRLKSPHTIEVYDFGTSDDGTFYYAMELLEGLDLKTLVERNGPLPAERVIHLLTQTCESLEEAHRSGLVHRDVKPSNLFTCRLGLKVDFIKVLDFGLVKYSAGTSMEVSQLTTDGVAPGSPAYLAPEMAMGTGHVDARSDIYSLGCVAYWLLTGQLVFVADSPLGVVLAHLEKAPEPPSTRVELPLPEELEALVLDCLRKEPDERPPSMRVVAERLNAIELEQRWDQSRAQRWWERHRPATAEHPIEVEAARRDTVAEPASARFEPLLSDEELDSERERRLHVLQNAFAHSRLDVNELSRRTELVQHASSPAQLDALVADLVEPPAEGAMVLREDQPVAVASDTGAGALVPARRTKQHVISFMGGSTRRGRWRPAKKVRALTMMGGTTLDFREAELPPGLTEVRCYAFMGGVDVIVPPDLPVEVNGVAFFGGFEQSGRSEADAPSEERPYLRIGGFAMMGGVDVVIKPLRPPGDGLWSRIRRRLTGEPPPPQLEHKPDDEPT